MAQMAQNDFLNPKKMTYVLWTYRYDLYLYHSISKYGPNRNDTFANLKSFAQLIDDPLHQLSKFVQMVVDYGNSGKIGLKRVDELALSSRQKKSQIWWPLYQVNFEEKSRYRSQ